MRNRVYNESTELIHFTRTGDLIWSERETQRLLNTFELSSKETLLQIFPSRTWKAITVKAYELKITRGQMNWSKDEEDFLVTMKDKGYSYTQIMEAMPGRSQMSLKHKYRRRRKE